MLAPAGALTLGQLAVALTESRDALGERLNVIDAGIACGSCGEIDLLAVDCLEPTRDHRCRHEPQRWAVSEGAQPDWMDGAEYGLLRRMYQGRMIDFSRQPRLFLVGPRFSTLLTSAVGQIAHTEIRCFRYYGVNLAGGVGIVFEPVDPEDH